MPSSWGRVNPAPRGDGDPYRRRRYLHLSWRQCYPYCTSHGFMHAKWEALMIQRHPVGKTSPAPSEGHPLSGYSILSVINIS